MDFEENTTNQKNVHTIDSSKEQHSFNEQDQHGLYKAIFNRRDVRGQFLPEAIPHKVLSRILYAAHHAPSVGFMQPWDFIVIQSPEVKNKIHQDFSLAHQEAQAMLQAPKNSCGATIALRG